jgi:hypothetical protein
MAFTIHRYLDFIAPLPAGLRMSALIQKPLRQIRNELRLGGIRPAAEFNFWDAEQIFNEKGETAV